MEGGATWWATYKKVSCYLVNYSLLLGAILCYLVLFSASWCYFLLLGELFSATCSYSLLCSSRLSPPLCQHLLLSLSPPYTEVCPVFSNLFCQSFGPAPPTSTMLSFTVTVTIINQHHQQHFQHQRNNFSTCCCLFPCANEWLAAQVAQTFSIIPIPSPIAPPPPT